MLFEKFLNILRANLLPKEPYTPDAQKQEQHSYTGQKEYKQARDFSSASSIDAKEKAYYQALEITPPVPFVEIKAAYKKLVKKYHPDKFHYDPQKKQYAEIVTQKINEAYTYFEKKAENKL